jgi:3-dehydroquinate synthase
MIRVEVTAQSRAYSAFIEDGLLQRAGKTLTQLVGEHKNVFVVSVPQVKRRWGKALLASLSSAGLRTRMIQMPDGETHKKLSTIEKLAGQLVKLGANRDALLIAFGGGIVGDVTGLLASIYMRGVDLVHIPTTVLAQVDASIGGKNGVNLSLGKNLLGTFYPPRAVLIDPAVLSTLPQREFRAGLYEVLKCGVIGNPELFERIRSSSIRDLRRNNEEIEWIIAEAVRLKSEIVSADERESGLRRVLNFGHTIGHALEAESKYHRFLHGEAVAWGMIAATQMAAAVGTCNAQTAQEIISATLGLGPLPTVTVQPRHILNMLASDKKVKNGRIHFVLPKKIGEVEIVDDVPERVILDAVGALRRMAT